jgi:sucrose-6-phosphate hydrolase SacC (GH32 family)
MNGMRMKRFFVTAVFIFLTGCYGYAQDTVVHWKFDKPEVALESQSNAYFELHSNWDPPETIQGVSETAWRLDGYSTWLQGKLTKELPRDSLFFSTWFALEAYPSTCPENCEDNPTASLFHRDGLHVGINRFGRLKGHVSSDQAQHNFESDTVVSHYSWNHVVVQIKLPQLQVYLNGDLVEEKNISGEELAWSSDSSTIIGRHPTAQPFGVFTLNMINGALDEMQIRKDFLSSEEVRSAFEKEKPDHIPNLEYRQARYENDPFRPEYHPIPQSGWTNEPHGFVYHEGRYHFFYQKTAQPYKLFMNWGHISSPNLVQWQDNQPVLWPEKPYDTKGIWSGTAIVDKNNTPAIMYTGVDFIRAHMCLAYGNDSLDQWNKYGDNPVVAQGPEGYQDFRDPYIWKENDIWYMIVGSGIYETGTVVLYTSRDLKNWEFQGRLYRGREDAGEVGTFWEMPVFLKFDDTYVLVVNTLPDAHTIYWTGKFENNEFVPDTHEPKKLEVINTSLAPMVTTDEHGRKIGINIIPDTHKELTDDPAAHKEWGWANVFSLPRIWKLKDGRLIRKPLEELQALRNEKEHHDSVTISSSTDGFFSTSGRRLEFKATIKNIDANKVGFEIGKNPDGSEVTRLYYNFYTNRFTVDRSNSSTYRYARNNLVDGAYDLPSADSLDLHVYVDHSVVEVFINNQDAFSTRIFPQKPGSDQLDLYVEGGTATFKNMDLWSLKSMENPSIVVEEPTGIEPADQANRRPSFSIWPNPTGNNPQVKFKLEGEAYMEALVYNQLGQLVLRQKLGWFAPGEHTQRIQIEELQGRKLYFLELKSDGQSLGVNKLITD